MTPARRNQNWLPSIFNDVFGNEWIEKSSVMVPAVNILENEDEYKVEMAVAGLTKEDFKIHVNENDELVVSSEKHSEHNEDNKKKGTYLRREFSYSQFRQSMLLPDDVDKEHISAKVEHGVLTVDLPKKKPAASAAATRQIDVK